MMIEKAQVIHYQAGVATVVCYAQSACSGCSSKSSCGTSTLAKLSITHRKHIIEIACITPLKIGQYVEIGVSEKQLMSSIFLLYVIPLMVLVGSTFLASYWFYHELLQFCLIASLTLFSFLGVHRYIKRKKIAQSPILLRVH